VDVNLLLEVQRQIFNRWRCEHSSSFSVSALSFEVLPSYSCVGICQALTSVIGTT
jgi:hypothetical protein